MSRIDPNIAAWQREGPLFNSYQDPSLPGDRLCEETHNVYHHDQMVQVGPFFVHKDIYDGHFYPPQPEDYAPPQPSLTPLRLILLIVGLACLGIGVGFVLPV